MRVRSKRFLLDPEPEPEIYETLAWDLPGLKAREKKGRRKSQ